MTVIVLILLSNLTKDRETHKVIQFMCRFFLLGLNQLGGV